MNDVPGAHQSSPQLRPGAPENERSEFSGWMKAGDSRCGCQNQEDGLPSSFLYTKDNGVFRLIDFISAVVI